MLHVAGIFTNIYLSTNPVFWGTYANTTEHLVNNCGSTNGLLCFLRVIKSWWIAKLVHQKNGCSWVAGRRAAHQPCLLIRTKIIVHPDFVERIIVHPLFILLVPWWTPEDSAVASSGLFGISRGFFWSAPWTLPWAGGVHEHPQWMILSWDPHSQDEFSIIHHNRWVCPNSLHWWFLAWICSMNLSIVIGMESTCAYFRATMPTCANPTHRSLQVKSGQGLGQGAG